jgi:hypothetical protein
MFGCRTYFPHDVTVVAPYSLSLSLSKIGSVFDSFKFLPAPELFSTINHSESSSGPVLRDPMIFRFDKISSAHIKRNLKGKTGHY